jgi:F0F1-type ATP synthase delta subunit
MTNKILKDLTALNPNYTNVIEVNSKNELIDAISQIAEQFSYKYTEHETIEFIENLKVVTSNENEENDILSLNLKEYAQLVL